MLSVFFIGVLFTLFTLWITISMFKDKDGYFGSIAHSYEDNKLLTIMFFITQIIGVLMLYFGFVIF